MKIKIRLWCRIFGHKIQEVEPMDATTLVDYTTTYVWEPHCLNCGLTKKELDSPTQDGEVK